MKKKRNGENEPSVGEDEDDSGNGSGRRTARRRE